jgi:hypothetical protein
MRILPRSFGQVLNDAISSLLRTWRPLASTAIMVFLPVGAATLLVFELSGATDFLEAVLSEPSSFSTLPNDVLLELARPFILATTIALVLQGLATLYVYLVCHRLTALDIKGEPWNARIERRNALRRYGRALASSLIVLTAVSALIALGALAWGIPAAIVGTPNSTSAVIAASLLVALLAPGVWLGISQSMLTSVLSLEELGVIRSLRRSHALVKGRWWATFGFLLMIGLLGSVAIQLIQIVAIPMSAVGGVGFGLILVSLLGLAAQGPIVAAMGAAYTHWYVDLRSRREPFMRDQL